MTRFVSTRYPELRIPGLRVRFSGGVAEVADPAKARRLAKSRTEGVRLADGESLPKEPESGEDDGGEAPQRPADAAPKGEWHSYVLATVDLTEEELRNKTKAELIALADQ